MSKEERVRDSDRSMSWKMKDIIWESFSDHFKNHFSRNMPTWELIVLEMFEANNLATTHEMK